MAKKSQPRGPSILIVYYSAGGNTAAAAEALQRQLEKAGSPVTLEKLNDGIKRSGFFGALKTGQQAIFKTAVPIFPPATNPADFDIVIVGSATYAGNMAPAVRTWLEQNRTRLPRCGFFGTGGDKKNDKVVLRMEEAAGKPGIARMYIPEKIIKSGNYLDRITIFMDGLGYTL